MSRAAQVTSIRSRSWPEAVTSSAVTAPPACSTAVVSWLTAAPPAGTSSRTVIEYDTEGTALTGPILSRPMATPDGPAARLGAAAAVAAVAAHRPMSPRPSATASRSGKWSGVQAKAGTPSAARAAACSWSYAGAPESDRASSTTTVHAGPEQLGDPAQQLVGDAALVQVGDQHEDRLGRPGDQLLRSTRAPG